MLCLILAGAYLGWRVARQAMGPAAPLPESPAPQEDGLRPLSFDELATLLQDKAATPEGFRFAREFAAKPRLRRIWSGFMDRAAESRRRQAAGPSAEEFVRALKREREFNEVFARLSGESAFRALVEALGRERGLADALRAAAAQASGGGEAAGPPGSPEPERPAAGKVYGLFAAEAPEAAPQPAETTARAPSAGGGAAPPRAPRASSDSRIEGHWVHDSGPLDLILACRQMGLTESCRQAIVECRKEAGCARQLAAYERETGGVAKSTGSSRGQVDGPPAQPVGDPSAKPDGESGSRTGTKPGPEPAPKPSGQPRR